MASCDAKGRDCIEKNSYKSFHCNKTCSGIYANVQWVGKNIEEKPKDHEEDASIQTVLEGKIDQDLLNILLLLKNEMKLMKHEMKNDIGEVMKIASGQRGEELDKEKYKMLVSEYRRFKARNVRHFRFNSAANMSTYGKT